MSFTEKLSQLLKHDVLTSAMAEAEALASTTNEEELRLEFNRIFKRHMIKAVGLSILQMALLIYLYKTFGAVLFTSKLLAFLAAWSTTAAIAFPAYRAFNKHQADIYTRYAATKILEVEAEEYSL